MLLTNDNVLIVNRFEASIAKKTFEIIGFKLTRTKIEYINCSFSNKKKESNG